MRAWAVVETGEPLQAMDWPTPEPKGAEVLIEVTHCGVCHSDLHIWEGGYDLGSRGRLSLKDRGVVLPLAMGHEIAGRVAAMGPEAKGVSVGEAKVVFPWIGCGKCERCAAGEDNMCPNQARTLGIYRNGGYATHVLVPDAKYLVPVDDVNPAVAATYACSGITVYSAIRKLGSLPPERPVVLVGAGGLGLNAIQMLKAIGHRRIVSVDVSAEKLAAAREAGATETVLAEGDVTAAIVAACGGPALAVIDLVNGSATARFAFDALGKGGVLVQVGLFGGEMTVPLPIMAIRALTVQGSYVGSPADLRDVMALAKAGKLAPLPVSTAPMEQAGAVLERLRDGKVTGRVVLRAEAA
ncbi:alcohol dehydrogenase [Muricoccus aerilatus]|uniref:alcohol dehydrogenase n=1 Tax=Muricoccus aerilatus TaxID=452982 RepID=UPI0005C17C5A|nr:alcohol dehydrogenase [Roseomonas aerilata]